MPTRTNKLSECQILELVIKSLSAQTQADIAKDFKVSEHLIQYYESKQETQELKSIIMKNAVEVAGKALGELARGSALTTAAVRKEQ